MTNEEKIISILENIQKDVSEIKTEAIQDKDLLDDEGVKRQLAVAEGLRHLLTKEEAEKLAAIVGI